MYKTKVNGYTISFDSVLAIKQHNVDMLKQWAFAQDATHDVTVDYDAIASVATKQRRFIGSVHCVNGCLVIKELSLYTDVDTYHDNPDVVWSVITAYDNSTTHNAFEQAVEQARSLSYVDTFVQVTDSDI